MSTRTLLLAPLVILVGCASLPNGPRVAVMPAPGKPFEVFVTDDRLCRGYAEQSLGMSPQDVANRNAAGSAIVGTAVGAAAGALAGGQDGAAVGAAIGMVAGTASGASQGSYSGADAQRRYDIAYQQCMYAKGNQLPGYRQAPASVSAPAYHYPPPPPPPR